MVVKYDQFDSLSDIHQTSRQKSVVQTEAIHKPWIYHDELCLYADESGRDFAVDKLEVSYKIPFCTS